MNSKTTKMNGKKMKKSPYAAAFKSGVKSGKGCWACVCAISKKTGVSTGTICQSLYNAGLCCRTKFNGTWIYWPTFNCKTTATNCSTMQTTMWQCFIDWCCCCGFCTSKQLNAHCTSQKAFMSFCSKFFTKKSGAKMTTAKKAKKSWKTKTASRKTTSWSGTKNYKFPVYKTHTTTKRYKKVA